jgi:putative ABC transport system permease protein
MLTHIFKLIWKKKVANLLLIVEIFFSFLVLFAVFSLAVYFFQNYRAASGMQVQNVWVAFLEFNQDTTATVEVVQQKLRTYPEITSFALTHANVPYSFSTTNETIEHNGQEAQSEIMNVDANYPATLGMTLSEGRWFTAEDTIRSEYEPIVITRSIAEVLFGDQPAVDQTWSHGADANSKGYRVVGVVDHFKHKSDFQERSHCLFRPYQPDQTRNAVLMNMRPGTDANFEARMTKDLMQLGAGWSVEVQYINQMKGTQNLFYQIPMSIALVVCAFLAINVALGLLGVLFQNINRRRGEIGVRRAMGATARAVQRQFIGETAMLTTLGVLLGAFIAVQFPLLSVFDAPSSVYFVGMALAAATIYGLALLCAWYPSRQAARLFPAEVLRE